jgi:hypothetical protein
MEGKKDENELFVVNFDKENEAMITQQDIVAQKARPHKL